MEKEKRMEEFDNMFAVKCTLSLCDEHEKMRCDQCKCRDFLSQTIDECEQEYKENMAKSNDWWNKKIESCEQRVKDEILESIKDWYTSAPKYRTKDMNKEKKDELTNAIKKSHAITPISTPLQSAYTAEEVTQLIENDRTKVEVGYAHYLQKITTLDQVGPCIDTCGNVVPHCNGIGCSHDQKAVPLEHTNSQDSIQVTDECILTLQVTENNVMEKCNVNCHL